MTSGAKGIGPTRIELASSELEGGNYIAWVDPQQVLACVAQVDSRETFSRFLEPRLSELDRPLEEIEREAAGQLPPRVHRILDRLRQSHSRLYRENRGTQDPPRTVRPVLVTLEEGTVYFVKATRCWVFRVRDGVSELVRSGEDPAETTLDGGLGQSARLHLAVSSVEVKANDVVVLLAADADTGPDRRAVAQIFEGSQDLKRACDGLVNLFGLTSTGVGAVAMRFVPVGTHEHGGLNGASMLEDLGRELARDLEASTLETPRADAGRFPRASIPALSEGLDEFVLPGFLEEVSKPFVPTTRPAEGPDAVAVPEPVQSASAAGGTAEAGSEAAEVCHASVTKEEAEGDHGTRPSSRPATKMTWTQARAMRPWLVAFGVVLAMLIAVVGVPRGVRLMRGGAGLARGGVLRIEPDPAARAIFVDGVDQQTGSPAILEGIDSGSHQVRLDLGAFGSIETKVRVGTGETVDLRPRATGGIEIAVIEARPGAAVWISGGERSSLPCKIESLPVGWHEVFYEDDRIPLWQRQVLVLAGETTRLRINNAFSTDRALLRVESWAYRLGEGLHASEGDTVFVDRRFYGTTPLEREIAPGLHGVSVARKGGLVWTEVLNLTAGSSRMVAPRFGLEPWPRIEHQDPGRILLRGPVLLTATFISPEGTGPCNPRLHLPSLDATVRDLPLSPVDPDQGVFVGIVDPRWIPLNEPVDYYFTVQTADGQTLSSELYRLTAVSEISSAVTRF
jgi:hypothetical protein